MFTVLIKPDEREAAEIERLQAEESARERGERVLSEVSVRPVVVPLSRKLVDLAALFL